MTRKISMVIIEPNEIAYLKVQILFFLFLHVFYHVFVSVFLFLFNIELIDLFIPVGSAIPERYYRPVCFPMAMCWLFGTLCYLLPLVFESLYVVLPVFIMFTFYRSFLFAIGIAFLTEA